MMDAPLLAFGKSFLFALATILPIINPAATAPIFLSLTEGAPEATRALLGSSHVSDDSRNELASSFTPDMAHRQAFYPLTFPLSCGPGSIAAAITVGVSLHDPRVALTLARLGGGVLAIAVIGILMFVAFRYARVLLRPLGEAGTLVFLRLSAFILLCLGVQIVWEGLRELLREVWVAPPL
jgi:multiple antibiotic resistance protein